MEIYTQKLFLMWTRFFFFAYVMKLFKSNITARKTFSQNLRHRKTISNESRAMAQIQNKVHNKQKIAVEGKCGKDEFEFKLFIRSDSFSGENSWDLTNEYETIILSSKEQLNFSSVHAYRNCIPNGCYTFKMLDSFGDGMNVHDSNGSYKGFADGIEVFFGKEFQNSASEAFCSGNTVFSKTKGCMVQDDYKFDFKLQLKTDNFGNETSWDLRDYSDLIIGSSHAFLITNGEYTFKAIYPGGCYTFTVYDSWGDGFCCSQGNGEIVGFINGANAFKVKKFGSSYSASFCHCGDKASDAPSVVPSPVPSIVSSATPSRKLSLPPTIFPTEHACEENEVEFEVEMLVDIEKNGHDIRWELTSIDDEIIAHGSKKFNHNSLTATFSNCIRHGCYKLAFMNFDGEVITGSGSGGISVLVDKMEAFSSFVTDTGATDICTTKCAENEFLFEIELHTDNWGNETSWELWDASKSIIDSVPEDTYCRSNHNYYESRCYPKDCYTFYIHDKWGDGICCEHGAGSVAGYVDGINVFGGGDFGKVFGWFFCAD